MTEESTGAPKVFLETPRLILRQFTESDVDHLFALDGDPAVMRFITGGSGTSRVEIETDYIPAYLDYHRRTPGFGFWAVEEKASGAFIGWFHFRPRPDDPADQPELGYRLVASAWGRGYGSEGAQALIDKGFRELGVQRVVAETMVVNTASRRVMEKSGMRQVRVFHAEWPYQIDGDEQGDVEYAITRAEWEQARPAQ